VVRQQATPRRRSSRCRRGSFKENLSQSSTVSFTRKMIFSEFYDSQKWRTYVNWSPRETGCETEKTAGDQSGRKICTLVHASVGKDLEQLCVPSHWCWLKVCRTLSC
jgi:hypothetical protein